MSVSAAIRKLIAEGFTVEQALAAAEVFEASMKPERTARQDRNARYYAKRKASEPRLKAPETSKSDETVLNKTPLVRGDARVEDNLLPKKITGKEEKEDRAPAALTPFSELLVVLDAERAQAVVDHRQRLRKPLTAHAAKLLAAKFAKVPDSNAAADAMIASGWQGFEPEWLESRTTRTATGPPGKTTHGSMWADEAKTMGLIDDELPSHRTGREIAGAASGPDRSFGPVIDLAVARSRTGN